MRRPHDRLLLHALFWDIIETMQYIQTLIVLSLHTAAWCAVFAVGFALLARFFPCNPGMNWWNDRTALRTDAYYWFLLPLVLPLCRQLLVIVVAAALFAGTSDKELVGFFMKGTGFGPLGTWPLWVQALALLALSDVYLYWVHRLLHTNRWWRIHAIHHSPKVLDWTSTRRFHIINMVVSFVAADVLMLALGFSPAAIVLLAPYNMLFSVFVHSNLKWDFGPFRAWLASPVFHRWHHTSVKHGGMKNFAPTFPVLDIIFGTYYMPKGELPKDYGIADQDFPDDFWGQLLYPFKQKKQTGQREA